jgi:hypothetical protein
MTHEEIKEFFKSNKKVKGTLTTGEVVTIASELPSIELKIDRDSQEYYYSIPVSDLKKIKNEHFLNDLRTLGFYLSDDNNFLMLNI